MRAAASAQCRRSSKLGPDKSTSACTYTHENPHLCELPCCFPEMVRFKNAAFTSPADLAAVTGHPWGSARGHTPALARDAAPTNEPHTTIRSRKESCRQSNRRERKQRNLRLGRARATFTRARGDAESAVFRVATGPHLYRSHILLIILINYALWQLRRVCVEARRLLSHPRPSDRRSTQQETCLVPRVEEERVLASTRGLPHFDSLPRD